MHQQIIETNKSLLKRQDFTIILCIVHVLDDPFTIVIFQCNISNNRIVFCCNNRNAHFQYRPTLVRNILVLK